MDFAHDQLATGRKVRVLTIVDTFSRFSPALEPRFKGTDVVEILEGICKQVGFLATIRVGQGSEFVPRELDLWAYQRRVTLDFSMPGRPTMPSSKPSTVALGRVWRGRQWGIVGAYSVTPGGTTPRIRATTAWQAS